MVLLSALQACGGSVLKNQYADILHVVPSDALSVATCGQAHSAAVYLDGPLSELDLSGVDAGAAVVWGFNGRVQQMLCIDAKGPACDVLTAEDTLRGIAGLYEEAGRRGLHKIIANAVSGERALIITDSENMMTVARTHIASGTSILDAPDFPSAATLAAGNDALFLRAGALPRLVGQSNWTIPADRKSAVAFLSSAAVWYIAVPEGEGGYLGSVSRGGDSYWFELFREMPLGSCRLAVPDRSRYAISFPWVLPKSRDLRERWIDSQSRLDKYRSRIEELKKETGVSPLKWEKLSDVREISAVVMEGGAKVVLVRTAESIGSVPDGFCKFPEALYGSLFSLPEDAECAVDSQWIICGKRNAIEEYLLSRGDGVLTGSRTRMIVRCDSLTVEAGRGFTGYRID